MKLPSKNDKFLLGIVLIEDGNCIAGTLVGARLQGKCVFFSDAHLSMQRRCDFCVLSRKALFPFRPRATGHRKYHRAQ